MDKLACLKTGRLSGSMGIGWYQGIPERRQSAAREAGKESCIQIAYGDLARWGIFGRRPPGRLTPACGERASLAERRATYEKAHLPRVGLPRLDLLGSGPGQRRRRPRSRYFKSAWPTGITTSLRWRGITRLMRRRFRTMPISWSARAIPSRTGPGSTRARLTRGLAAARTRFRITFDLPEVAAGYYRLVLDFVDTQGAAAAGVHHRHQRHVD